jgi:hypothetical protein
MLLKAKPRPVPVIIAVGYLANHLYRPEKVENIKRAIAKGMMMMIFPAIAEAYTVLLNVRSVTTT